MSTNRDQLPKHKPRPCKATTKAGHKCSAYALQGSDYCISHDPSRAELVAEARYRGGRQGKRKTLPGDCEPLVLHTAEDVVDLLTQTIDQVRTGAIDPKISNAIGYLCGYILKAREQGEIEERLKQIEETLLKA